MIDEPFRQWLARRGSAPAAALARAGITANQITVVAAVLGLTAAALVAVQLTGLGIALWLVSRLLDGFDGMVARLSGQSSLFGGYLDITLDMLAYSAMAIAFAIAMPADVVLWMLVLLALLGACGRDAVSYSGIDITGANFGKEFHLNDPDGRERSLAEFRGKYVLLFFGYTQCPDVCPTALARAADRRRLVSRAPVESELPLTSK